MEQQEKKRLRYGTTSTIPRDSVTTTSTPAPPIPPIAPVAPAAPAVIVPPAPIVVPSPTAAVAAPVAPLASAEIFIEEGIPEEVQEDTQEESRVEHKEEAPVEPPEEAPVQPPEEAPVQPPEEAAEEALPIVQSTQPQRAPSGARRQTGRGGGRRPQAERKQPTLSQYETRHKHSRK